MGCDATSESTLLATLQSSSSSTDDLTGIHTLFASHLHPFTPYLKPSRKPAKSKSDPQPPIRTLAKQFLPFIHKSLILLPKRLSHSSPQIPRSSALELLHSYHLCLDCLELIAPELSGKPRTVHVQRVRYVHCLEQWEMYEEAEGEGFAVLESLSGVIGGGANGGKKRKSKGRLVPEVSEGSIDDRELAVLVLEIVVTLVKCASKRRSRAVDDYRRVVVLVNESEPWFKVLDAKDYEKFHHFLVTNLHITTLYLVAEIKYFDVELIREFASVTFKEYKKSSAHEQMYKVALKICSSVFSQRDDLPTHIIVDVLKYILEFMAAECKVGLEKPVVGFLDLVCYCANKCHGAIASLCDPVAEYLNILAGAFHELKDFPIVCSVLRLYATGLLASSSDYQLREGNTGKCKSGPFGSALQFLLDNKERLHEVAASLNLLKDHSKVGGKEKHSHQEGVSNSPSYWEALKFFCQLLAESIYFNRKEMFSEPESTSSWSDFGCIHDAFHQFCYIFLHDLSESERERETSGDNYRVISSIVVADLVLSLKTNQNIKESTLLVKHVILTEWLPVKRLKYLYVSLNNIAVILNRKKQLKEASIALKLCCKASWNYVTNLCKMHANASDMSNDELSEKAIADVVKEASEKTAFLLELNQECSCKINSITKKNLQIWSVAESLMATVPTPTSLVKEWVKIGYLSWKDTDSEHRTTLHSLLQSSTVISKRALGKLLEEELHAYDEKSYMNSRCCSRMQMKLIAVLLEEFYVTEECNLRKARVLMEKGKLLRTNGLASLDECIQCLSDAISILKSIYSAKSTCSSQVHHLLVHAYILHALCAQESVPNSTVLSQNSDFHRDIHAALKLYLSSDHQHADEEYEKSDDMLYLCYQLLDLLSTKGYLEIHPSLYDVVIKLSNQKNFPLVKTVAELWKYKRLSHALCTSHVNDMFIETFSKHQAQLCNCADFWRLCIEQLKPLQVGFLQSNVEIKQAATDLGSQVPLSSRSIFQLSHLYYDLSERLISRGRMIEALTHAKEAHHLRSKLLRQKFEYSVEKVTETFDENGAISQKSFYGVQTFKVSNSLMTKGARDYEGWVLTPWNVLSSYLESILQVGLVQEILGNGSEAEMLLRWGRNVSQFWSLPLFEITFASILGKLYYKQKLWRMAEKELSTAKKTLADNREIISCGKCASVLEINIDRQMGDLFMSSTRSTGDSPFTERLFNAKTLYRSALDKLTHFSLRPSDSTSKEARSEQAISIESLLSRCSINLQKDDTPSSDEPANKIEPKRSRRTKKEMKLATNKEEMVCGHNRRMTRSARRALVETHEVVPGDRQNGCTNCSTTEHKSTYAAGSDHNVPKFDTKSSVADFQSDLASLCNKMKCWHCLQVEAVGCSSLYDFICMNWELAYKKISLRLLISIGKFSGVCDNVHEAHELLVQSISVLFRKNSSCSMFSSPSLIFLIDSIGRHFPGDVLAVERAALLYYMCWFALRSYRYQGARKSCCELSCVGTTRIVSWLKLAFILCREVPSLFQKVSRLLAAVYVLSTSMKPLSLSPCKEGSESQWASFFHQASVGTHLDQQIFSGMTQKKQSQIATDFEDSLLPNSKSTMETPTSLSLAPDSCEDLEEFVRRFFQSLPSTPVICISLVAGADAGLLRDLLHCPPTVQAFILLSHLSSDNQQSILLPIYTILEEASDDDTSSSSFVFNCKDFVKQWVCPWVSSVIDDIAPVFKHVLEGNYYSSSEYFLEYIKENTSLWWMQRNRLDECLSKFLQDMEDLWLGTWKYTLLGIWPDNNILASIRNNCSKKEEHLLQLVVNKNCYVRETSAETPSKFENMMQLLFNNMLETSQNLDQIDHVNRKPIILVLDSEVQMLPWENLPILRNQEVYRMPSVASILATLNRCCGNQEQLEPTVPPFPLIDPLDSYYLLNPDGDLSRTQVEFEDWFKDQNIEGKVGTVPTIEELTQALKNHDLFIYFGHGSGTQYIPGHEIQKLDGCAATLLLGCSSGSLYLKGCYMPQGAPISYLLAGSPIIVANLWEVTDKDIDRFGKAMLNAWLRERSAECSQCDAPKNKSRSRNCRHRPRIGSFMEQARDACTLSYLIGAAPVCYGVPTGIVKRKNV